MWADFRKILSRGNVVDLATAVVIGAAFGKIVSSFVEDIMMPPLGMALGRVDFSSLFVSLTGDSYASIAEAKAAGAPTINYGIFVNAVVHFVIIAFAIFLLIKAVEKIRGEQAATTKDCPHCLSKIPVAASKCAQCTSDLRK